MTVADKNLPRVSYVKGKQENITDKKWGTIRALDIWLFACQLLTFVALVEYAVVNVQLRMEVEDRAKLKKLQEEADERCQKEAEEEDETLDDTTLWLMDMVTQSSERIIFIFKGGSPARINKAKSYADRN